MPEKFWESPGATLFISGFISILGMAAVLRELAVFFHGIELIYPAAIGGWLFFTAIGSLFGKYLSRSDAIAFLFTLFSLSIAPAILFLRGGMILLDSIEFFSNIAIRQSSAFIVALFPGGLISGSLFANSSFRHRERYKTEEGAYCLHAAGGMTGGIAASAAIHYGLSNLHLAFFSALLASAAGALFFMNKKRWSGQLIAVSVLLATFASLCKAPQLDMRMTAWRHPGLFFSGDFPDGRLSATYNGGVVSVFENGGIAFTTQDKGGVLFAHFSALQHPEPLRILEIGGGWGGNVNALLLHKPVRIDVMLPPGDPYIRYRLPPPIRRSLANPTVHLFHADPREFLKRKGFAWDLIVIDAALPQSCHKGIYYTRDFFYTLARRLYKGGVVSIRLPPINDVENKHNLIILTNVYRNLAAVFPERLVITGTTTMLAASFAPFMDTKLRFHDAPEILTDRIQDRGMPDGQISSKDMEILFYNSNDPDIEEKLHAASPQKKCTIHPTCYTSTAASFAAKLLPDALFPQAPDFDAMQEKAVIFTTIAVFAVFLLFSVSRLNPRWRKTALAAAGGFLGTANLSLIILYQNLYEGALYRNIPLLLALFLAGLSLRAPLFLDFTAKRSIHAHSERRNSLWTAALLVSFMILNAVIILISQKETHSLTLAAFLSAITGFLTSGLFFRANSDKTGGMKKFGAFYTANLIGGSLGALSAGIFLIPALGFAPASMALIVFAALTLLAV